MKKLTLCICILAITYLNCFAQTVTLTASNYNGYNVRCFGNNNGSITANVTGGTPPYTYTWSNGATTSSISNLRQGYYSVRVDDANTATDAVVREITLTEPASLVINLTPYLYPNQRNISCYGCSNGSITNVVTGGVTPYTYSWQPSNVTVQSPANLGAGDNVVTVTDANTCTANASRNLSQPDKVDWTMTGNAGTNPATQFFGTTDNQDLSIKTYNQERLRVIANGDIKVNGLAGGAGMVYVDADGTLRNSNADINAAPCAASPNAPIWGGYTQNGANPPLIFSCPSINVAVGSYTYPPSGFKFSVYGNSYFQSNVSVGSASSASGIKFLVSGNSYFNGNVGVGTNNAAGIFEAKGTNPYLYVTESGTGSASLNLKNSNGFWHISGPRSGETNNPLGIFWNANTRIMSLLNNGTVVISSLAPDNTFLGTNGLSYKLLVDGNIGAREIRVKTGLGAWPDYVFTQEHKLTTLAETENAIAIEKHLPGFPTANEIEKEGQNLGQLQILQQEKLEELYLHMIALEKRVKELENKQLKKVK